MKTQTIIALLLVCTGLLTAQSENKETHETKVRIKKVENINGVKKTTDTTYVIKGPVTAELLEAIEANVPPLPPLPPIPPTPPLPPSSEDLIIIADKEDDVQVIGKENSSSGKPGKNKIVIVTDEIHGDNYTEVKMDEVMDEQIERALKAAGVDEKTIQVDKVVTVNATDKNTGNKKETKKIIVIKTTKVTDLNDEDQKILEKTSGVGDNKLNLEGMNFYPNPNTGKFKLSFELKDKAQTEINILNVEGRTVYNEKLRDFTGRYDKEIDISSQPKGVYFLKVTQGAHAQTKKLVIE